ncbi:MAG: LysM peptidoglycan-binding domain-containing protein [Oscillospiraceae bacterium]|nr:LysM peptidoglycan-binding domain-containing protein [Oscillospiraceae bacterium]
MGLSDEDLTNLKKNLSAKLETCAEAEVPAETETLAETEAPAETETPAETEPETPVLIAPALETADTIYVVIASDCLWNLAKRFYNDPLKWKMLAEVNQLSNSHLIFVGRR